jgi:hypothetical protein
MKSRTHQQWRELFKQQADGHLSVAAFCKQHGIGQSYFYKRKSDLTVKNSERLTTNFIKVKPQPKNITPTASIKLQYQQTRLHLPTTISPRWLAEFIKALA